MILKGSVNVTIESDTYKLIKNEIEIINLDEAHRIFSNEDNLVLLMHIDANFLQRYYDDIKTYISIQTVLLKGSLKLVKGMTY